MGLNAVIQEHHFGLMCNRTTNEQFYQLVDTARNCLNYILTVPQYSWVFARISTQYGFIAYSLNSRKQYDIKYMASFSLAIRICLWFYRSTLHYLCIADFPALNLRLTAICTDNTLTLVVYIILNPCQLLQPRYTIRRWLVHRWLVNFCEKEWFKTNERKWKDTYI